MEFKVISKATGAEVFRYTATAATAFDGLGFDAFDHVPVAAEAPAEAVLPDSAWRINVGPYFDRFGDYKVAILASTDPVVQALIKDASVRHYIDLKGRRADLAKALSVLRLKGFAVTDAAVLDTPPREDEIFKG